MTTEQVSEEEFDYQLLFKPPETPTPATPELNLVDQYLKQLAAKELFGEPYVRDYLHDQKRRNCRPSTLRGNCATLVVFLSYLNKERGRGFKGVVETEGPGKGISILRAGTAALELHRGPGEVCQISGRSRPGA